MNGPNGSDDLIGDERNVILTLARMLVTFSTGEIVSKDEAARLIGSELPEPARSVVSDAAASYLGRVQDDWSRCQGQVQETADHLPASIRKSRTYRDAFRSLQGESEPKQFRVIGQDHPSGSLIGTTAQVAATESRSVVLRSMLSGQRSRHSGAPLLERCV